MQHQHSEIFNSRACAGFYQSSNSSGASSFTHPKSRGDGMVVVIRRGGSVPVEVGRAFVRENRNGQEILSLEVGVGREPFRGSESWDVRYTFG